MYYIIYPLLYFFSLTTLFILYGFSNILSFLLCHVFRYRRDVVMGNLEIAFPEKPLAERKKIARRFYLNFTDSFVETLKLISISEKELRERATGEFELVNDLLREGKSVNLLCGHQFNREYGNLLYSAVIDVPFVAVYLPVKSKVLNRIIVKSEAGSVQTW
ncbi:MAG: hypothetical protein IPP31_01315 [Chitinophagaceae bacterium]|nr:hypothetical protein [Chitinophagaceae bacterium]